MDIKRLFDAGGLVNFLSLNNGILTINQFMYLTILSINPAIFKIFKTRNYFLFAIGIIASIFNSRAIMPILMLLCLDLDYSKLSPRIKIEMLGFFLFTFLLLSVFGGRYGN